MAVKVAYDQLMHCGKLEIFEDTNQVREEHLDGLLVQLEHFGVVPEEHVTKDLKFRHDLVLTIQELLFD